MQIAITVRLDITLIPLPLDVNLVRISAASVHRILPVNNATQDIII